MSRHKYTNLIGIAVIVTAAIITAILMYVKYSEDKTNQTVEMQYETKLFDDKEVHNIDIKINQSDWDHIQENASDKEYVICDVVIDGEDFQNVAIRVKGNSSLTQVTSQDSERYSFKIEFDHYNDGTNYWGLDKLSLNNIIQDSTFMKDYLAYKLMREMGAAAPLSSFVYITVNGEEFGLYLAVEGIEEAFAQRNYGVDYGYLYKPESADMANMGDRDKGNMEGVPDISQMFGYGYHGEMPDMSQMPGGGYGGGRPDMSQLPEDGERPDMSQMFGYGYDGEMPDMSEVFGNGGGMGGMFTNGKSDVALQYSDDKISSYTNIFDGAIFDITKSDKKRLISSIKQMNDGENLEDVLNIDEILRYFVVHNFVDNFDSYTGSMMHNYYLYEKDGKLSVIAWDYNLSFGGFSMGGGMMGGIAKTQEDTRNGTQDSTHDASIQDNSNLDATQDASIQDTATTYVNFPIDTPVSGTTMEERPLLNNLLSNEEYLTQYHEYFDQFISSYFESGYCEELIDSVSTMIAPYVKKDTTAFYTYDEFLEGVSTLKEFCNLRAESIRGQLEGTIPSTTEGQTDTDNLIDASSIKIEDMGSAGGMNGMNDFDKNANSQQKPAGTEATLPERNNISEEDEKK